MDLAGAPYGLRGRFGKTQGAHLALFDQPRHRAYGLFDRRVGIDAMLVVKIDCIDAEAFQAALDRLANVLGLSVDAPEALGSAYDSELGGDHRLAAPPANRAPDQFLVLVGTIHVRRVQMIHAEIERAM